MSQFTHMQLMQRLFTFSTLIAVTAASMLIGGVFTLAPIAHASGTLYVKSDATGAANGSSWDDAYTTVQAAVTAAATGTTIQIWAGTYSENLVFNTTQNGKDITLVGGNGGSTVLTRSSGIVVNIQSTYTSGTLEFENLAITATGTATSHVTVAGRPTLVFTNCTLGTSADVGKLIDITSTATSGSVTITGGSVVHNNTSNAITIGGTQSLTIQDGSVTAHSGSFIVTSSVATGTITLRNLTVDASAMLSASRFFSIGAAAVGAVLVDNCTLTYNRFGFYVTRSAASVTLTNNTITATGSAASLGLAAGLDGSYAMQAKIGAAVIEDNTVTFTNGARSHGILVGSGVTTGTVRRNQVVGSDHGIVLKSRNTLVENNTFISATSGALSGVFFRGGIGNTVRNNTFYNYSGSGIYSDAQDVVSSPNSDVGLPTVSATVASYQVFSGIAEGGNLTLLAGSSQPAVSFRPRVSISNNTAGSLDLYEGTTSFLVSGTLDGSPVSETLSFTSDAGNKSVAAGKYRTVIGEQVFDVVTSITVTNKPDNALRVDAGTAGMYPSNNTITNNIFYQADGNEYQMIREIGGTGDGNLDQSYINYNLYRPASDTFATLNVGGALTDYSSYSDTLAAWDAYGGPYNNDANSVVGEPGFIDVGAGNLRVSGSSPAIDAGIDYNIADSDGKLRYDNPDVTNTGSAGAYAKTYVDIGAYERYIPPAPVLVSSTHPQQSAWYASANVALSVLRTSPTTTYNYLVSQTQNPLLSAVLGGSTSSSGVLNLTSSTITSEGVWYAHYAARNDEGDGSESYGTYIIQYDATAPAVGSVSLSGTPAASGWYTSSPALSLVYADALSGIASSHYRIGTTGLFLPLSGSTQLPDGIYTISHYATDGAGNVSVTSTSDTIRIDTQSPSAFSVLATPSGRTNQRFVTLAFETTDTTSGISHYTVSINGEAVQQMSSPAVLDFGSRPDGVYAVTVAAYDGAGNVTTSTVSVTRDTAAPVISIDSASTLTDASLGFVSLQSNEVSTCRYAYAPGIAYDAMTYTLSGSGGATHTKLLSGLQAGATYVLYVRCADDLGNTHTSDQRVVLTVASTLVGGEDVGVTPDSTPTPSPSPSGTISPTTTPAPTSTASPIVAGTVPTKAPTQWWLWVTIPIVAAGFSWWWLAAKRRRRDTEEIQR